jgi:hypothetical protein
MSLINGHQTLVVWAIFLSCFDTESAEFGVYFNRLWKKTFIFYFFYLS